MNTKFKKLLKVAAITAFTLPMLYGGAALAASPGALLVDDAADLEYTDDTGGTTGTLTVTLSPGVQLVYIATPSTYAIWGMNLNVNYEVRNEYGVASDYEGYYMRGTTLTDNTSNLVPGDLDVANSEWFAAGGWTAQ